MLVCKRVKWEGKRGSGINCKITRVSLSLHTHELAGCGMEWKRQEWWDVDGMLCLNSCMTSSSCCSCMILYWIVSTPDCVSHRAYSHSWVDASCHLLWRHVSVTYSRQSEVEVSTRRWVYTHPLSRCTLHVSSHPSSSSSFRCFIASPLLDRHRGCDDIASIPIATTIVNPEHQSYILYSILYHLTPPLPATLSLCALPRSPSCGNIRATTYGSRRGWQCSNTWTDLLILHLTIVACHLQSTEHFSWHVTSAAALLLLLTLPLQTCRTVSLFHHTGVHCIGWLMMALLSIRHIPPRRVRGRPIGPSRCVSSYCYRTSHSLTDLCLTCFFYSTPRNNRVIVTWILSIHSQQHLPTHCCI